MIVTLVPLFFAARWQAAHNFKNSRKTEFYQQKQKLYKDVADILYKIVRDKDTSEESIQRLRGVNSEILLVGSRRVVQALGDFFVTIYAMGAEDEDVNKRWVALLGEVIKCMRIDLGLDSPWYSFRRFMWYDSLRPHFYDIYDIYPTLPLSRRSYWQMRFKGVKSSKKLPRRTTPFIEGPDTP